MPNHPLLRLLFAAQFLVPACLSIFLRALAVGMMTAAALFLAERHPVAHHTVYLLYVMPGLAAWRFVMSVVPVMGVEQVAFTSMYDRMRRVDLVLVTLLILVSGPAARVEPITAALMASGTPEPGVFDVVWYFATHLLNRPCAGGLGVMILLGATEYGAFSLMPEPPRKKGP
jgi:hypothetical protein